MSVLIIRGNVWPHIPCSYQRPFASKMSWDLNIALGNLTLNGSHYSSARSLDTFAYYFRLSIRFFSFICICSYVSTPLTVNFHSHSGVDFKQTLIPASSFTAFFYRQKWAEASFYFMKEPLIYRTGTPRYTVMIPRFRTDRPGQTV